MSTTTKPDYRQPAFLGGLVMGVLSALPIVNVGNACCCLWVVTGGVVAAYLLQQSLLTPIETGDAALVGLFAGLIGAVVTVAISFPLDIMFEPFYQRLAGRALEMAGPMPPEVRDSLERFSRRGPQNLFFLVVVKVLALMFWAFIGAIFSTLGGLLGGVMFKKNPPPPGVIDSPAQP